MKGFRKLHSWRLTPKEAVNLQGQLRDKVSMRGTARTIRWIVGVDVAYQRKGGGARVGAVVCQWPDLTVEEEKVLEGTIDFPYIPGLLSFREAPIALKALSSLSYPIDCLIVDGHGLAHPRGFGLASHLGFLLDKPTIGCAKSRLWGEVSRLPGAKKGSWKPLKDPENVVIGAAVTTKDQCKPLYVSIGHRVSLKWAIEIVLTCCRETKHPEPLKLSDRLSKFKKT